MPFRIEKYRVHIEFITELLGTQPLNTQVFLEHVVDPDEVEQERIDEDVVALEGAIAAQEEEVKGKTGFFRHDDVPCLKDHMIKGFCKEACGDLWRATGTLSKKLKAYKKTIDGLLHVFPRYIPLQLNGQELIDDLPRPLRAQTAQGERTAIAHSEVAPEGTEIDFEIHIIEGRITEQLLVEWLDYGLYKGLGQWRNASHGRFNYTLEKLS